jgi:hypothetical protein
MHGLPGTLHCHPFSMTEQSPAQPSPFVVLPSSHVSIQSRTPLPQLDGMTLQPPLAATH